MQQQTSETIIASELIDAYKRVGAAFRGQLQQNFVVLHDGQEGSLGGAAWVLADNCTIGGETNSIQKK
jgi:hypothetical protein